MEINGVFIDPRFLALAPRVLRRAGELIQQGWQRGMNAANVSGQSVSPYAPEACKFCAGGALRRAAFETLGEKDSDEFDALFKATEAILLESVIRGFNSSMPIDQFRSGHWCVECWNDSLCPSKDVAVLRLTEAAELARAS